MSLALSISVLFILFLKLVNGAQFLNVTRLFLSYAYLFTIISPAPVIVILPLASMCPSL